MPATRGWFDVWAPLPYALLAVAAIDWLGIPVRELAAEPWLAARTASVSTWHALELVWKLALLQGLIGATALLDRPPRTRAIALVAVSTAACAVMALLCYELLVEYHRFRGYAPFAVAAAVLWAALTALYVAALAVQVGRRWRALAAALAAVATVAIAYVNATRYRGQYPTLHAALLATTYLLAHAAAAVALSLRARPARPWLAIGPPAAVAIVAAAAGALTPASSRAVAFAREHTIGGPLELHRGDRPPDDQCLEPVSAMDAATARALFAEHAHMPALPDGFRLTDYNLLLVMIEAVRYDDTSFGGARETTPHLARFASDGATSFARAHSPSSRTATSLGSLFDLTYPSHARMEMTIPPWTAALDEAIETPAELFADAGYSTWRLTHRFPPHHEAVGYFQGFGSDREVSVETREQKRVADETLTELAEDALARHAASGERFFGWIYLIGPHTPYLERAPGASGPRDRYRQEIAHADALVGRILDQLRATGLLDRTVVVVMADHGEEFGEHGFRSHGLSLFGPATHVPLLVWVPGVRGRVVSAPTSATYVLPWLFQRGTERMRALAEERIREHFGPMLAATGGAVVTELNDWERLQSALVWPDASAHYNFHSGLYRAYDLRADPGETRDLVSAGADEAAVLVERIDRYRAVRACGRRVRITNRRAPSR